MDDFAVHLMFAAFVLAVPMFAVIIDLSAFTKINVLMIA